MASVFLFGLSVIDLIFHVDEIPHSGLKFRTTEADLSVGGCATNASVAIQRLGGQAFLSTRVGEDAFGTMIVQNLRKEGVDVEMIRSTADGVTAFSAVAIDPVGERQIVSFRGKRLESDPSWLKSAPKSDAYLVDTTWPAGVETVLATALEQSAPSIVDADATIHPGHIQDASHIAFSMQSLVEMTGEPDAASGLRKARSMFSSWLCVTDGENGVFRLDGKEIEHIPAFNIDTKNTLAAGDVWHGAFALGLAEGRGEDQAILFANGSSALKCSCQGSWNCFPHRTDVEKFIGQAA